MTKEQLSKGFAYSSLACSLSFWLSGVLSGLQIGMGINIPGVTWLITMPAWTWRLLVGVGLILAIPAAVFRSKLSLVAFPLAILTFLLIEYAMSS